MLLGEQQDSSHVGFVVVERMQLRRGHVKRTVFWETIVQSLVHWQQVHIMHGQVVCVITTLQVTNVNERRSIEPETIQSDLSQISLEH